MRHHGMKRFVLLCLLALAPVFLLVALYVIRDPFHVVKPYNGKILNPEDSVGLTVNWGYITVESFKYFDPENHFDSFIFGSSLSGYYRVQDWQPYLPAEARPFHFNASRETLRGMLNKMLWLTHRGVKINNALIVMEDEMLMRRPLDGDILFAQHPSTAPELSWWEFQQLYFNAFRRPLLVGYMLYPQGFTQQVIDEGFATKDLSNRIESINEGYYAWADSVIAVNPDEFFTPEHIAQYSKPLKEMPCPDKITTPVAAMLKAIKEILDKHGTDYQIIIPPHYGYEAIGSSDLYALELIFGQDRVHDYSHDPEMGSDLHYYYDDGHLIASQCARLIDSAYHAASLQSPFLKKEE